MGGRTRSPFVSVSSFWFIVRKVSVDATTIAALEDRPEPAGTAPVTSRSIPTGSAPGSEKNLLRTPFDVQTNANVSVSTTKELLLSVHSQSSRL